MAANRRRLALPVPPLSLAFFSLFLAVVFLALEIACSRLNPEPSLTPTPQEIFDHARQIFLHGDLAKAQSEADAGARKFAGGFPQWAWRFELLEAEVLVSKGNGKQALSLLGAPTPPELAQGELAIKHKVVEAGAKIILRRLDEAEQDLRVAESLSAAAGLAFAGEILRTRGLLEGAHNRQENAAGYYRQSLQIARRQSDDYLEVTDLINLGHVTLVQERYDESIDWLNNARQKAQARDYLRLAEIALGNLGWAYYKMGDFDRALAQYQEAVKGAENFASLYSQIDLLGNLGLIYEQIDQPSTAEKYYRKSLELAQKNGDPKPITDALTSLAFVALESGETEPAQQYADQAYHDAYARGDRPAELSALLAQGQLAASKGNPDQAAQVYKEVAADRASDLSLRWQAENNLALLYERQHRLSDADRQFRAALATIELARTSLQHEEFRLPFQANAAHLYDDYIRFLLAQGKTGEALRLADYSRARTLAEGLGVRESNTAINPDQIARRAHATILFYWLGRKQSYLWAINAAGAKLYWLPPAEEIDAAVERYAKALLGWQDVLTTSNPDGNYLYHVLIEPVRQHIPPSSRVFIIADGALDGLNFETLPVPGSPAHFWIDDVTVTSASSLRVLDASRAQKPSVDGKLLLIGNPVSAGPEYPSLPSAPAEIESVENHFRPQSREVFTAGPATPSAYLSANPAQFTFIHFVAHATASKLDPLDSAIILTRSSAQEDSFKLYAREIKLHPLRADLVTISSCSGAGAKSYTGEGLVGLSWAFLRAGAHNVIGALWDVSDDSTATLMDHLYRELKSGHPPDQALRAAKLALLHSQGVTRKPFYWAPFQLYTGR